MFQSLQRTAAIAAILTAVFLASAARVVAVSVGTVIVSPLVVAVPSLATQKTAVLVSASVAGVTPGGTVSCTASLTRQPSGTVIVTLGPANTSPAPASGTTSVSFQALIPGATAAGAAQAAVTCGDQTSTATFRIASIVGLSVFPASAPAGGVVTFTVMIAAGGSLAATPCSLVVTDPAGSSPPLSVQTVSLSGGSSTVPASTSVNITLPNSALIGIANGSVSCIVPSAGTFGDSADFTVTPPSTVTILGITTPALAGSPLTVTSVTLPGFSCVALFTPPAGAQIDSAPAVAGATGTAVNTIALPAGLQPGAGSLTVACSDPLNPANLANSAAQSVLVLSAGALPVSANCAGLVAPAGSTSTAPVANAGSAYTGATGEPLQFRGAGSLPSAGAVLTTCVWSFGDGDRATTLNPTHTYAAAGSYAVTLTVSDSAGLAATATATASIGAMPPLCSQPASTGIVALGVCAGTFTCPATSLPGQCLPPCATLVLLATLCPQPSRSIKVVTGGPYVGAVSQLLTFQGSASIAGTRRVCAADATLGTGGPFCNLVPATDLPSPVSYSWDFGDGTRASGNPVGHAYGQTGSYVVILTVTFDDGTMASGTTTAPISAAPPPA